MESGNDTHVNIALLKKEDQIIHEKLDTIIKQNQKIVDCVYGNSKPGLKTEFGVMKTSVKWLTWGFRFVIMLIIAFLGYLKYGN